MITVTVIILVFYTQLIVWTVYGIKSLEPPSANYSLGTAVGISVVIPFRNESKRLSPLLKSLKQLNTVNGLEIIFVDDQSTDNAAQTIVSSLTDSQLDYKVLALKPTSGSGKKAAIELAVQTATHNWIVTLDADAELPNDWVFALRRALQKKPDLLVGPIAIKTKGTILNSLQEIEAAGIGQLGRGKLASDSPVVANGAHLAYNKVWFESVNGYEGNRSIASGDDMFLLAKAVSTGARIHFLNDSEAVVKVQAVENWNDYFWQRVRWLRKSSKVQLDAAKNLGILITTANLWTLILLIAVILGWVFWTVFVGYLILKTTLDLYLLHYRALVKIKHSLPKTVLTNLLYPGLMVGVLLLSLTGSYSWKGRRYKK